MKRQFFIRDEAPGKDAMLAAWSFVKSILGAGHGARVTVELLQPKRSVEQNALLWSALGDIAHQVEWPVDGRMSKLEAEDWKHILSAGLVKSQRVAQGIEGGFVILGQRTSRMTIAQMGELIELVHAFGADKGVQWSPTSIGREG